MRVRIPPTEKTILPPPRWSATIWLLAPVRSIGAEGDAELRQTLIRRLDAVLLSGALTMFFVVLAFSRHPAPAFGLWLMLEILLASVRVPVILVMAGFLEIRHSDDGLPPWITDAFVCLGTGWSTLLGCGAGMAAAVDDPGLAFVAALVTMGTIGAQGCRSPGTPRLNAAQICLIIVPFASGSLFSHLPLVRLFAMLAPIYLLGMINSIVRQLHDDYLSLLTARIENRNRAMHCPLTGLPNRVALSEALQPALDRLSVDHPPLLLMALDLDGFKSVNDSFGHAAGDILLVQVARRLQLWNQSQSLIVRIGGDEFAILLSSRDRAQAERDAQTLIDALRLAFDLGADRKARIGVSVGLAASALGMDHTTLMHQADQALYAAKRAGRGTFRWYDPSPGTRREPGELGGMADGCGVLNPCQAP